MTLLIVILASLAGTLLSLIGGVLLLGKHVSREKIMLYAMPLAAGAFLGAAFLTVLPEALHLAEEIQHVHQEAGAEHPEGTDGLASNIFLWTLLGFVLFFIMERSIRWFHRHHEHAGDSSQKSLVVVGDTLHNAIDGVAIGAAFLVNIPFGIAATVAVAAHEIPQEVADFGILISKGMKRKRVLLINLLSGLAAVITAALTFSLGGAIEAAVPALLAIVAGYFIYIAASDIIPDIHERAHRQANLQAVLLIVGIAVIGLVAFLLEDVFGLGHSH